LASAYLALEDKVCLPQVHISDSWLALVFGALDIVAFASFLDSWASLPDPSDRALPEKCLITLNYNGFCFHKFY
jgi:hypothetical protein